MRPAAWAALLCLLMTATTVRADDARDRARQLFDESAVHYRAGRFDRAAELLEEAHRLTGEPVLLFNLAKAHEGNGDLARAITAYQRYLRDAPDLRDRGAIERRIETLRAQLEARRSLERDVETQRRRADDERRRAAEASREKRSASLVPWVIAGVGAAGVAVGGVLGALAKSKESDAETEPVQLDAASRVDEGETLAIGANVAFAVGGTLLAGGVTWGIIDAVLAGRSDGASARVRVNATSASLVVTLPR
jgi:tetratricopeptide (TPR) repeat protein